MFTATTWQDIAAHRPLVESVVREFGRVSAFDRDDLMQEGFLWVGRAMATGDAADPKYPLFLKASARNAMVAWLWWRDGYSRRTGVRRWVGADTAPLLGPMPAPAPRVDGPTLASVLAGIDGDLLTPRERSVMRLLFGLGDRPPTPPLEAARLLGTTPRSIHRARERAAAKLRAAIEGSITPR